WLRAGDLYLEWLVHRLHGVGHVDTRCGARDLPGVAVLGGLGFALAGARLIAQVDAVDVAETHRLHVGTVLADHRGDTRRRVADRACLLSPLRLAPAGPPAVLILAVDRALGAAPAGCRRCARRLRAGGCLRRRSCRTLGLLLARRTA